MDQVGIGIVGAGHIARSHLRALAAHPTARAVAVYDVIPKPARATAEEFGIPHVCPDLTDLVNHPDVQAVIVSTPPDAHMQPTIAALEAAKHVLCEKPFALDPSEAEQMVAAAERNGKYLAVASGRRRCPAAARSAHELITSGRLGQVYHVRSSQFRVRGRPGIDILKDTPWFLDRRRAGGGALIDIGVYDLDLMLWLLGNPQVTNVLASTHQGIGEPASAPLVQDVEDHASVTFTCDNGASGVLEIGWSSNISGANAFLVLGTEAGLRFGPLTYIRPGTFLQNRAVEERVLRAEDGDTTGFGNVTTQFADAVRAGREPYTPARDALEVTRVIDAAYRSVASGTAIQLNLS